jgi:hypothetical protein
MAEGDHPPSDDQEKGTWNYRPEGSAAPVDTTAPVLPGAADSHQAPVDPDAVEWTASEFIHHDKGPMWYLALAGFTILVCGGLYLLVHDIVTIIVIGILATVMGVAASRKPRIVVYRLDRGGLSVGKSFHPYGDFKSFAVIDEDAFASITLLPLKRFNLPVSVYFSPEDEHIILDIIAKHLPLQPGALDSIDRLMRNIHF